MKLSFIVPVYRTEAYLPRCVDSILAQSGPELELILVDDGSPDGCPAICDRYAALDPRVRVIHQANAGVVRARNRGIDASRGDYLCFVDSDDAVSPRLAERLDALLAEAEQPPDLLLYGFRTLYRDRTEETLPRFPAGFYDREAIRARILPHFISDRRRGVWWEPGVPVYLFCKAFRRDFLLSHRFTDEAVAVSEDAAQSFECLFHAQSLCVCPEALYDYDRTNPISVTRRYRSDLPEMFARLFAHLKDRLGGADPAVDRQLNDYFAYRVLRAVNMEAEHRTPLREASARLRRDFARTGLLDYVETKDLPLKAAAPLALLRRGLYGPALLALRLWNAGKKLPGRERTE